MICETHLLLPFIHEKYPLIPFFQGDENCSPDVPELCAKPTLECLKRMLQAAGFSQLEVKYTPSFRYWKKFVSLVTNYPQSGRGIVHAKP